MILPNAVPRRIISVAYPTMFILNIVILNNVGGDLSIIPDKKTFKFRPLSEKGWLKFLLLKLLYDGPKYGYQLSKELVEKEYIKPDDLNINSIYIVLNRIEEHNLATSKNVESEAGRPRRIYTITDKGVQLLKIGLENILDKKKVFNELEKFYEQEFRGNSVL